MSDVPVLGRGVVAAVLPLFVLAAFCQGLNSHLGGLAAAAFARELAITPEQLGVVFLTMGVGFVVGALAGGWMADRVGLATALALSLAVYGSGTVAMGLSEGFLSLAASRLATGLGLGAAIPAFMTYFNERDLRGTPGGWAGFGLMFVAAGRIAIVGSVAVAPELSWRTLSVVAGILPLLVAGGLVIGVDDVRGRGRGQARPAGDPRTLLASGQRTATLLIWLIHFLVTGANFLLSSWLPSFLVADGLSPRTMALVMLGLAISTAIGAGVAGWLGRHIPVDRLAVLCFAPAVPGLVCLLAGGSDVGVLTFGAVLVGFAIGAGQTSIFEVVGRRSPAEARATALGAAVSVGRASSGLVPMAVGLLIGAGVSQGATLLLLAPMLGVSALVVIALSPR